MLSTPQWSPPRRREEPRTSSPVGPSPTRRNGARPGRREEPAGFAVRFVPEVSAAMEPAPEGGRNPRTRRRRSGRTARRNGARPGRREEPRSGGWGSASTSQPQWSPPRKAGGTRHRVEQERHLVAAAMEPASEGGRNPAQRRAHGLLQRAAMEPASEGGRNHGERVQRRRVEPAAMEPASEGGRNRTAWRPKASSATSRNGAHLGRREEPQHRLHGCSSQQGRRNGARLGRREEPSRPRTPRTT